MSLPEVISWIMERGISEAEAKSILPRAFRDGDIRTRGRSKSYTGHDVQAELPGVSWDQARVNWEESLFSIPSSSGIVGYGLGMRHVIKDVEVSRAELCEWLEKSEPGDSSRGANTEPSGQRSGRKRKSIYDWESFYVEIAVVADLDSLPDTQADLERDMADWCLETWGRVPSESTLRSKISPIYNHPRKIHDQ